MGLNDDGFVRSRQFSLEGWNNIAGLFSPVALAQLHYVVRNAIFYLTSASKTKNVLLLGVTELSHEGRKES